MAPFCDAPDADEENLELSDEIHELRLFGMGLGALPLADEDLDSVGLSGSNLTGDSGGMLSGEELNDGSWPDFFDGADTSCAGCSGDLRPLGRREREFCLSRVPGALFFGDRDRGSIKWRIHQSASENKIE